MAFLIYLENKSVVIQDETTLVKAVLLDLFTFNYTQQQDEDAVDYIKLYDSTNTAAAIYLANAKDENGNTFASLDDFKDYLSEISKQAANLGLSLKLDNMELSNTGSSVKIKNIATGEESFMVQQRVTNQGTQKVYYTELSEGEVVEIASNAYQPYKTHTKKGVLNNQGRYAMAIDFQSIQDNFTIEYRSESIADINGKGIENLNIKIFKVTQSPANLADYNVLSGVGIDAGWYISKRAYWALNKQSVIDSKSGENIAAGVFAFSFGSGISFKAGEHYRYVISADNEFELYGLDNITNPFGGTTFIPYTERTYTGEVEIEVETSAVKVITGAIDFVRDATNTSIIFSNGKTEKVNTIKAVASGTGSVLIQTINGAATKYEIPNHNDITINGDAVGVLLSDAINQLNGLFTVTIIGYNPITADPEIYLDGGTAVTLDAGSDLLISGGQFEDQTTQADAQSWIVSTNTIDAAGEFITFAFQSGNPVSGDSMQWGLIDAGSDLYINRATNGIPWNSNVAMKYSGSSNGLFNYDYPNIRLTPQTTWTSSAEWAALDAGGSVLVRVGINAQRYGIWSYWDVSESVWVDMHRTPQPLPHAEYALYYNPRYQSEAKVQDITGGNANVFEQDLSNIPRTYYAIESPTGNWHYPLFASSTEAEQYDVANGGIGEFTQEVFINDANAGRIWYAPVNAYTIDSPTLSTDRTWNIIATLDDNLFSPPAFPATSYTFDELSGFSVIIEQNGVANYTTEVIPDGASFGVYSNGTFAGSTPEVTGNNVVNPTDSYTFTVRRTPTNGFPPSQGTLTIVVNNLTAPATAITGFTWDATSTALIDADTMDDGSVVTFDNTVEAAKRFIIPATWVETYVLPALSSADDGDKIYIGIKDGAGVLTDGIVDADWDAYISWEKSGTSHISTIYADGFAKNSVTVHSLASSVYDYAFEADDHGDLYVIACNINDLNTQPGVDYSGVFGRVVETTGTAPFTLSMVTEGLQMDFAEGNIVEIVIPAASNWIQVTDIVAHDFAFNGVGSAMPTLQAGYTYRFLMADVEWFDQTTTTGLTATDILKFTADGTTEYTTGITRSGAVGSAFAYVEFAVPTDVPPLWWFNDKLGISQTNGVTLSGSTYVIPVTGVTLEGPVANQTGNNLFDAPAAGPTVEWGWLSIDEQLSAGERLVLDNAFLIDLTDAMPNNSGVFIGLKSGTWTNTYRNNSIANATYAGARFAIYKYSSADIRVFGYITGASTIGINLGTNGLLINGIELAFEVTSSGNNIRMMLTTSANSSNDVNSTTFDDWHSSYKTQTGDQGFGITSLDVMVLGDANINATGASGAMDSADVDWTGLSEISVPQPPVTNNTPWTKAVDFSGGSEYLSKANSSYLYSPLNMGNAASTVAAPTAGQTVTSGHPWAIAIVFKIDGHSSNQHIWNNGEGAGTTDDNIYLRVDSNGNLYFGWGRQGELNELYFGALNTTTWYGCYIGFNGTRLSGANATAANLADAFEVRLFSDVTNWQISSAPNSSTSTYWNLAESTTGGRMDRQFTGTFTVGGRGGNRNFHGKVASMIVTTLRCGVAMPTTTEIKTMVTDPIKWVTDYKLGNAYRRPSVTTDTANFAIDNLDSANGTQVWLMGDVSTDSYANGVRSYIYPTEQNRSKMQFNSMVSSDIETVNINGLT